MMVDFCPKTISPFPVQPKVFIGMEEEAEQRKGGGGPAIPGQWGFEKKEEKKKKDTVQSLVCFRDKVISVPIKGGNLRLLS